MQTRSLKIPFRSSAYLVFIKSLNWNDDDDDDGEDEAYSGVLSDVTTMPLPDASPNTSSLQPVAIIMIIMIMTIMMMMMMMMTIMVMMIDQPHW